MFLLKFQPTRPYSILHVYQFWEIFCPACLFHPARLLDTLEKIAVRNERIKKAILFFTFPVTEMSGLPSPAIWIGVDDKRREGDFRYFSDGSTIPTNAPFGRNQPNGTYTENCITTFPEEMRGKRVSKWWNRHPKWWDRPCSDRKLVISYPIPEKTTNLKNTTSCSGERLR